MNDINNLFFELIRVAIGNQVCLSRTPSADEWGELYAMAKKQSLVGICFAGVQRLQMQQQYPPELLYLQWMGMAAKIQQRNEIVNQQCIDLQKRLSADGYRCCILKGQGIASLYKTIHSELSLLRQSGDIDIWMLADPKTCIDWARGTGKMYFYDYHHADLSIFQDTELELHYRPSISRNLIRNKRLQMWFAEEGQKHIVYDEALGFCKPDYSFNVVLCLNHLLWHLMYEGIGMRQMMDLYFVLRTQISDPSTSSGQVQRLRINDDLLRLLEHFKLMRFAAACMWIMKSVFGMEDAYLLCELNEREGRFLLEEIMKAGNFGKHDERLMGKRSGNRIKLMWTWLTHNMRLLGHYTEEVLWTPIGIVYISLNKTK